MGARGRSGTDHLGLAGMTTADPAWRERVPADGFETGLAEQVRLRVRDSGVDPQRDAGTVRRIAESVAQAHDERSLTGAVAPLEDLPALVDDLVAQVAGFGPLQRYLDDPSVEEVWINEPSRVFVARHGRGEGEALLAHVVDQLGHGPGLAGILAREEVGDVRILEGADGLVEVVQELLGLHVLPR